MSKDEEIDMLRRDLAELRERVARLEAKPAMTIHGLDGVHHAPLKPPIYAGGAGLGDCGCPAGAACGSSACPRSAYRLATTCGTAPDAR